MEGVVFEKKLSFGVDEKCCCFCLFVFCTGIKHLVFGVSEAGSNPHCPFLTGCLTLAKVFNPTDFQVSLPAK